MWGGDETESEVWAGLPPWDSETSGTRRRRHWEDPLQMEGMGKAVRGDRETAVKQGEIQRARRASSEVITLYWNHWNTVPNVRHHTVHGHLLSQKDIHGTVRCSGKSRGGRTEDTEQDSGRGHPGRH